MTYSDWLILLKKMQMGTTWQLWLWRL